MKSFVVGLLATFGLAIAPGMAATFVQTGNNVTAINDLVVLGNTYNITFGDVVDTTFNSSALAISATDAIRAALNSDPTDITVGSSDRSFIVCSSSSSAGFCDGDLAVNEIENFGGWNDVGFHTGSPVNVDNPAADFQLVSTPEPRALTLFVPGLMLVLFAAKRGSRFVASR